MNFPQWELRVPFGNKLWYFIVCYNLAILRRHHKRRNSGDGCDQEVSSQTEVQFQGMEISLLAIQIWSSLNLFAFLSDLLFQFKGLFFPFLLRFNFGIYLILALILSPFGVEIYQVHNNCLEPETSTKCTNIAPLRVVQWDSIF